MEIVEPEKYSEESIPGLLSQLRGQRGEVGFLPENFNKIRSHGAGGRFVNAGDVLYFPFFGGKTIFQVLSYTPDTVETVQVVTGTVFDVHTNRGVHRTKFEYEGPSLWNPPKAKGLFKDEKDLPDRTQP